MGELFSQEMKKEKYLNVINAFGELYQNSDIIVLDTGKYGFVKLLSYTTSGEFSPLNSSSLLTWKTCANAFNSMSVTKRLPDSILCMAFLSRSNPCICNISANFLCDVFSGSNCRSLLIFLPQILFSPLANLFLYIYPSFMLDNLLLSLWVYAIFAFIMAFTKCQNLERRS